MIGLLQRVTNASVVVNGQSIALISNGLLVLVGVEQQDKPAQVDRLLQRLLGYRVFADSDGKMNKSLVDVGGDLLLVPQFTLAANTNKGMRPSFTSAVEPKEAEILFNYLVEIAQRDYQKVKQGRFGADMQVSLTNDGPVTFWLQV